MSLSEQTMLDIMAYADGQLDSGSAKRIEKLIARDEEARNVLEAMQTLTDCIQIVEADRPQAHVDVDAIVDSVMKTISTLPIPVDEERPRRLLRAGTAGAVSFIIAIAAGWALFAPPAQPTQEQVAAAEAARALQKAPVVATPATQASPPVAPAEAVAANEPAPIKPGGVELDHVESPSHEVSVFYVPALAVGEENASTSVVVWIGDNQRGL